jgi:chromate transporter
MAPTSVAAVRGQRGRFIQWIVVSAAGLVTALLAPQYVVLTLLVCGVTSVLIQESNTRATLAGVVTTAAHAITLGGLGALSWVAFKVGALSYGGGFVIIPLMQRDVVSVYHWMTGAQFLNVVALGQITPGPVVLTTAAVGYAAHGLTGALVAASVAFAPSFLFILVGAGSFERIRSNARARAFLAGAAPCVIGAIAGSSIPLGLLLVHLWQLPLLAASLGWLLWRKGSSVTPLLIAAGLGALGALCLPV